MPEWLLTGILASVPGLLVAGGVLVRVSRLEADVKERVTREVFDLHIAGVNEKLAEIKALLTLRPRRGEDTNPGG
jgi:hypothetical protein